MNTDKNILTIPSNADLSKLIESCIDRLNDAIVITEAEPINKPGPRIIWANKVFYQRNGYSPEEIIGQSPRILQGPETDRATLDRVRLALEKWQSIRVEILNYRKDGTTYWNEFEIVPIANEKGWYTHWVSVQRDISERKQIEAEAHQLAFYDPLTKLPNRRLFNDRLIQAMAISRRSGCYGALMFLDLDNFKQLNDTHGHGAGDLLLVEVSNRLTACLREVDTVARFGGDEFVILLSELGENKGLSKKQASIIAEKVRATLAQPYLLKLNTEGKTENILEYSCPASIGVNLFINYETNEGDFLKWADVAMYQAKKAGRNLIRFYEGKVGME
jgi:diguanylate cyclase (GGDEF)-like protein/PAS domain S-box-containing protein